MSRGIRDLRDLICVSRLTIRDSDDDEFPLSDEDEGSRTASDGLSSSTSSRQSSAQSRRPHDVSPDSGIGFNGNTADGAESLSEVVKTRTPVPPPSATRAGGMRRKRKKKTKVSDSVPLSYDLPKPAVLPPVQSEPLDYANSSSGDESAKPLTVGGTTSGDFDDMLTYIDATVVSEWLAQANAIVTDLAMWCHSDDNFVHFAHFWLTDFSDSQKHELFRLETSIVLDQLSFAFRPGRDSGAIKQCHLEGFLEAVFREYPGKLLSSKGPHLFLEILHVLSSERQGLYKRVLTDVKISTRVKQHAQWCLAIRSFTLVSVWSAVVNFYRKLLPNSGLRSSTPSITPRQIKHHNPTARRLQQVLRSGYVDVLNYMIQTKKVTAGHKDEHNKTLIFSAVMHNQEAILRYLISQSGARPYVNEPADNGNTPLHAAANSGNSSMTSILLSIPETDVNVRNPQCDNATPLHLATMHGHCDVVKQLFQAGADTKAQMGDLDAVTIATDFGHEEILKVFQDPSR